MTGDGFLIFFRYLFNRSRRGALIWASCFALYVIMVIAVYPTFSETGNELLDAYPDALKQAFNIQDVSTLAAFLNMEIFSYAPLAIAFYPIMALASTIAGEEERGGLDIYLANPLSRRAMLLASWLATALWTLIILLIGALTIWAMARLIREPLAISTALAGALNVFPLTIAIGTFALLLSARLRQKGTVVGISFGLLFFMYLFDVIGKISERYAAIRWVSAFRYYGQAMIDGVNWGHVIILLAATLILLGLSIPVFRRRDVYT